MICLLLCTANEIYGTKSTSVRRQEGRERERGGGGRGRERQTHRVDVYNEHIVTEGTHGELFDILQFNAILHCQMFGVQDHQ